MQILGFVLMVGLIKASPITSDRDDFQRLVNKATIEEKSQWDLLPLGSHSRRFGNGYRGGYVHYSGRRRSVQEPMNVSNQDELKQLERVERTIRKNSVVRRHNQQHRHNFGGGYRAGYSFFAGRRRSV